METNKQTADASAATAHCLCGKVKFHIDRPPHQVGICHCAMCRRWTGGPMMAVEVGPDCQIEGEEHITSYASSDWAERSFCKICGSTLFYRLKSGGNYYMPAGLFDDAAQFRLVQQIFVDEKPDFYDFNADTPMLTGEQVFAEFAAAQTSDDQHKTDSTS